jgi:hypothetical protein
VREFVNSFIRDGFVRVAAAFSPELVEQCCDRLWSQLAARPHDPSTWTEPVVRLGYQAGGPFELAANTDRLRAAYDALVGPGRWLPRTDLGTFPVRFPSPEPPADDGWHIDSGFPPDSPADQGDPFAWRVNVSSRGRALLMLFLLTDVGLDDAPTRLRVGSHRDVAALLAPYREDGLSVLQASEAGAQASADRSVALATGAAGDVYLCHPFLVHAAQSHHGSRPRIIAQPPLHLRGWINASFDPIEGHSPVEVAIRGVLAADVDVDRP